MTEGQVPDKTSPATPRDVLAALGEVIRAVSSSGFDLDGVLQTIIRHAVDLSRADFGNILRPDTDGRFYRMVAYSGNVSQAYLDIVSRFEYVPDQGSIVSTANRSTR